MQTTKEILTNELIGILKQTRIRHCVEFEGVSLRVEQSVDGCTGCIFQTAEMAQGCDFKMSCMAHNRTDGKSVLFKPGDRWTPKR